MIQIHLQLVMMIMLVIIIIMIQMSYYVTIQVKHLFDLMTKNVDHVTVSFYSYKRSYIAYTIAIATTWNVIVTASSYYTYCSYSYSLIF